MSENNLPDKCDFCGLKQTYPIDTGDLFQSLRLLFDEGIVKNKFPRKIYMGDGNDRDDFCLISHPSWSTKEQPCESWQLDVGLPKGDILSINLASESTNAAKKTERLTKKINNLTLAIVMFKILQMYILLKPDVQILLSKIIG